MEQEPPKIIVFSEAILSEPNAEEDSAGPKFFGGFSDNQSGSDASSFDRHNGPWQTMFSDEAQGANPSNAFGPLSVGITGVSQQNHVQLLSPHRENGHLLFLQGHPLFIPASPGPTSPASSGHYSPSTSSSGQYSPYSSPATPSSSSRSNFSCPDSPMGWPLTPGDGPQSVTFGDYHHPIGDIERLMGNVTVQEYNGLCESPLPEPMKGPENPLVLESTYPPPFTLGSSTFRSQVSSAASRQAANGRRKVPENAKLFYCGICNDSFTRKKNLTNHENSHRDHRPYACSFCGQKFVTKHVMTRHQRAKHQPKFK